MGKIFRGVLLGAILAIPSGCGTTAKFVYPSNPVNLQRLYDAPKYPGSVAVLPFEEARSNQNSYGRIFLGFIPFVPYGSQTYERPEASRMFLTINEFQFNASEDLAKAAVASLQKSNLFKQAFFSYGGDIDKANFLLRGSVRSTQYKGKAYYYCVSFFGPILWFIGLPAGSSTNVLALQLALYKSNSDTPLWQYETRKEQTIVQGLYYRMGYDVRGYADLMESAMNDALRDLNQKVPAILSQ